MGNPYFQFKQFTVFHDKCAMKVGTDGVLLGAWANVHGAREVLDVGAGTGVVGLMIAQRNRLARVTAVELDPAAVEQATENAARSPFADRMTVVEDDFRCFAEKIPGQFDHIVCNPPYFKGSLLSPDKCRTQARHMVALTPGELLEAARECLNDQGRVSLILPHQAMDLWMEAAQRRGFLATRITRVHPKPEVPPKRVLLEIAKHGAGPAEIERLVIENGRHQYSETFVAYLKDFYLYL